MQHDTARGDGVCLQAWGSVLSAGAEAWPCIDAANRGTQGKVCR